MAVPDTIDLVLILLVMFVARHMDVLAILARAAFICTWRLRIRPSQMLKWFIGHLSRNELLEVQSLVNEHLQQVPDNHQRSTEPERSNDRVQSVRNPDIPVIASNLSDSLTPHRVPEPEPSYPVSWQEAQASVPDVCINQDGSNEDKDILPEIRESESETSEDAQPDIEISQKTESGRLAGVSESQHMLLENEVQQTRDHDILTSGSDVDMHLKKSPSHENDQFGKPEGNRHDAVKSQEHLEECTKRPTAVKNKARNPGKPGIYRHEGLNSEFGIQTYHLEESVKEPIQLQDVQAIEKQAEKQIYSMNSESDTKETVTISLQAESEMQETEDHETIRHCLDCYSHEKTLDTQCDKGTDVELKTEELSISLQQSKGLLSTLIATKTLQEESLACEMPQENSPNTEMHQEITLNTEMLQEDSLPCEMPQKKTQATEMPQEKTRTTQTLQRDSLVCEMHQEITLNTEMLQEDSLPCEMPQKKTQATEMPQEKTRTTQILQRDSLVCEMHQEITLNTEMLQEDSLPCEMPQKKTQATEMSQEKTRTTQTLQRDSLVCEMHQEITTEMLQEDSLPCKMPQEKTQATKTLQGDSLACEMPRATSKTMAGNNITKARENIQDTPEQMFIDGCGDKGFNSLAIKKSGSSVNGMNNEKKPTEKGQNKRQSMHNIKLQELQVGKARLETAIPRMVIAGVARGGLNRDGTTRSELAMAKIVRSRIARACMITDGRKKGGVRKAMTARGGMIRGRVVRNWMARADRERACVATKTRTAGTGMARTVMSSVGMATRTKAVLAQTRMARVGVAGVARACMARVGMARARTTRIGVARARIARGWPATARMARGGLAVGGVARGCKAEAGAAVVEVARARMAKVGVARARKRRAEVANIRLGSDS